MRLRSLTALALVLALSVITTAQTTVGRLGASLPKGVPAAGGGGGGGLLTSSNVVYQGSFRLPSSLCGSNWGFQFYGYNGSGGVAFNPANNSLFLSGANVANDLGKVAEVAIPALVQGDHPAGGSTNLTALNTAGGNTCLQNFVDVTNGNLFGDALFGNGAGYIYGMLVSGGKLYVNIGLKFDSGSLARVNFFRHGLTLSVNDFFGWESVQDPAIAGGVGDNYGPGLAMGLMTGGLSDVPAALQASLGGTAIASPNYGISIIVRTSYGPGAVIFDPATIGSDTPSSNGGVASSAPPSAQALLFYTQGHQTLGNFDDRDLGFPRRSSPKTWWSWNDRAAGGILEDQTYFIPRMFGIGHATATSGPFSGQDVGTGYYGNGTTNWSLNGTDEDSGHTWAFEDPATGTSPHSWPYVHQIVAYRVSDLVAVRSGTNPWALLPYDSWTLPLPFDFYNATGGETAGTRATYDRANRLLYIVQTNSVDQPGSFFPMVHVYHITASGFPIWLCGFPLRRRRRR